jgi:hypothetical protein
MSDYDLMGYGGGLGALLPTGEEVKESLMAGAAGGAGILLVSTVLSKIPQPTEGTFADPMTWRRTKGALAIVAGILGGRALYDRSPNASMAVVGAVCGLGMADLVASWVPASDDGSPMVTTGLSGGLSGATLRALEQAVSTPMNAWQPGMAGTVAQTRALSAPVSSMTELGNQAYQGFLS